MGGERVGSGAASCADTMSCLLAIGGGGDPLPAASECMAAADPAVSRESSALVRCLMSAEQPEVDCADAVAACQAR